jgi:hypothetical protein
MSEADQAIWAAILKSKRAVESARELWRTVRWSILGTGLFVAIFQALTGGGYSESIKLIIYNALLLCANEIVKIVLSKYELTIASSEAELSDRIVY